jgi:phosphoglycolate phosphatase
MFDHDGVVVDSFEVFSAALAVSCRALGVDGVRTAEHVRTLFDGNVYERLSAAGADGGQADRALGEALDALDRALPRLQPFPGMPALLRRLGGSRDLAIVTSNRERVVARFLERHGIGTVVTIAGAESGRSKVEKMRGLIERHPGQAVYWFVGDTAGDMREALLAGATPVGVAWGWHEPERLLAAGAARIAGTPAELLALLSAESSGDAGTGMESPGE